MEKIKQLIRNWLGVYSQYAMSKKLDELSLAWQRHEMSVGLRLKDLENEVFLLGKLVNAAESYTPEQEEGEPLEAYSRERDKPLELPHAGEGRLILSDQDVEDIRRLAELGEETEIIHRGYPGVSLRYIAQIIRGVHRYKVSARRLSKDEVARIKGLLALGFRTSHIGILMETAVSTVYNILSGTTHKHIKPEENIPAYVVDKIRTIRRKYPMRNRRRSRHDRAFETVRT